MKESSVLSLSFLGVVLLVIFHQCSNVQSVPVTGDSKSSAFYYLLNYGYIHKNENQDTAQILSEEAVTKAVKDFQIFAGLQPTGDLDDETVELMNTPRCGVKDTLGPTSNFAKRRKRYALQGSRWSVKTLTYRISKYPSDGRIPKDRIDAEIKSAFQLWSQVADIKLEKKETGSVHIDIRFEKGSHGDGDPFDGPGGTLAHAFFPQYGGDAHFDDEEYWTIDEFRGTNLKQTAAHELGHSLGLSHSDVRSALMAPFYRGWEPNLQLNRDDIEAIQSLYGKSKGGSLDIPTESTPTTTTAATTTRPSVTEPSSKEPTGSGAGGALCESNRLDAIFSTDMGDYFAFQGGQYWKLTEDSVAPGYPKQISTDWPGLPDDIDTAVTWPDNGMTYFFKGSQYWKFHNKEPQAGYPKSITDGFPGIPFDLDSAFVWGGNGKIYFIKDSNYYKFDPTRKIPVGSDYPKDMQNWGLGPGKIDTAVKWVNKYTYFFRDGQYYRFNDRKFEIDSGDPPFPRPTGKWWFGCQTSGNVKFSVFSNRENNAFSIKALKKDEAKTLLGFVDEGDEILDAEDPDS